MTKLNNSLLLEDIDRKIQDEGIRINELSFHSGFSANTYYNVKNKLEIHDSTFRVICDWLGTDIKKYRIATEEQKREFKICMVNQYCNTPLLDKIEHHSKLPDNINLWVDYDMKLNLKYAKSIKI